MLGLLIGLLSGAAGGNVAGHLMKSGMGTMGRSLTGIIGGTLLSFILGKLGLAGMADPLAGASLDLSSILGNVLSGGVGGGLLTFILGKVMK